MSRDVKAQLAALGQLWNETIPPVDVSEIVDDRLTGEEPTLIELEPPAPDRQPPKGTKRSALAGLLAAAAVVGVVFVATRPSDDSPASEPQAPARPTDPTEPPAPPVDSLPVGGPLAAGTAVTVGWEPIGEPAIGGELVHDDVTPSSIGDLRIKLVRSDGEPGLVDVPELIVPPYKHFLAEAYATVSGGRLLTSSDGVTWRAVRSPFPGWLRTLRRSGSDQYTLTVDTPDGITQQWVSENLRQWQLGAESSDTEPFTELLDGPGLLRADIDQSFPLPSGSTLARVTVGLDLRGQLLARLADLDVRRRFVELASEVWWEPEPGGESGTLCAAVITTRAAVITTRSWPTCDEAEAGSEAFVAVELSITGTPDAWELDVVDPAGGESLGTVRGSGVGDDLAAALQHVLGHTDWFVVEDGAAERVEPDWFDAADPETWFEHTETADGLLVYEAPGSVETGETDIWRSTDGRTWEHLFGDGSRDHEGRSLSRIAASPTGGLVATEYRSDGAVTILTSDDGTDWQPATQPPVAPEVPDAAESGLEPTILVMAIEHGFVYFARADTQLAVWTSADGDVWEPVEVPAAATELDPEVPDPTAVGGSIKSTSAGNVAMVTLIPDGGPDLRWIIRAD